MNSLPLSLLVISYLARFYWENRNLVPRSLVDEAEGEICKVRKFVFLDWLLHLTPVQSPL